MTVYSSIRGYLFALAALLFLVPADARADLTLSQLVVDLRPGDQSEDIEIFNDSPERAYLAIEAAEILEPGTTTERRIAATDPVASGILVTPARSVLEAGQRKRVRIASLRVSEKERAFRILVRPVSGDVEGGKIGLKLLIGYDVLVLVRPIIPKVELKASRDSTGLRAENKGNVSVELFGGQICVKDGQCSSLPGKRLYPGSVWSQQLNRSGIVTYRVSSPEGLRKLTFQAPDP